MHGPLKGHTLDVWHTPITDVATALEDDPELELSRSKMPLWGRLFAWIAKGRWRGSKGLIPFFFRKTMADADERLHEHTNGLGVMVDGEACFYPMSAIGGGVEERWGERTLRVSIDGRDGIPRARWADGSLPMQLFARWYGFSATYSGCRIYGDDEG